MKKNIKCLRLRRDLQPVALGRKLTWQFASLFVIILLMLATASLADSRGLGQSAVPQLASATASNATSADAPHRINEVSMLVSPVLVRRFWNDRLFCAFMGYPSTTEHPYAIKVAIGIISPTTTWTIETPPLQPGYSDEGDPVLASNPTDSGFHARRLYLAGRSWNSQTGDDQITVWHRDGAYTGWNFNTGIGTNSTGIAVDNPTIAVSQYSGRLGHVYVAYIEKGGAQQRVHFYRNPGTDSWSEALPDGTNPVYTASASATLNSTRMDVDPASGTIYLSWLNWASGTVTVMTSSDGGDHWSSLSKAVGTFVPPGTGYAACPGCVFAPSFLASTFNAADGSLALVYHLRKSTGDYSSEVMMLRYTIASGFGTPQVVSALGSSDDRWQGAVDCDTTGKCVVSYYDHHPATYPDPETPSYNVYDRRVNADGTAIPGESDTLLYGTASDASSFLSHRMEYHDVLYYNGQWLTADVIAPPNQPTSDVFVTFQ
jgi:hypothetical protein